MLNEVSDYDEIGCFCFNLYTLIFLTGHFLTDKTPPWKKCLSRIRQFKNIFLIVRSKPIIHNSEEEKMLQRSSYGLPNLLIVIV